MIGIIETELNAFSIMDTIKKKYPSININIFYLKDNIEEGINKLKDNNKIIIIPDKYKKELENQYKTVTFLSLKELLLENSYELNDKELIKAIETGNDKEVIRILKSIKINNNTIILINNPIVLWIKKIVEEVLNRKVVSNIDILLEDIEKELKKEQIDIHQEGKVSIIL